MSRKLKEKERLARRDIEKFRYQLLKTHTSRPADLLELQRACDRLLPILENENTRLLNKPITDGLRGKRTPEGMVQTTVVIPQYLYHGTGDPAAARILVEGITPRGDRAPNHPDKPSRHDRVYLTDCYALRYVFDSYQRGGRGAVVEVERGPLDSNLVPDEDTVPARSGPLGEIETYRAATGFLLYKYGTVAYRGTVPTAALRRVAYIPNNWNLFPTVTSWTDETNHGTVRMQQWAILHWVFDGGEKPFPVPFEELVFNRDLTGAMPYIPVGSEGQAQGLLDQGIRADTLWRMHCMMHRPVLNRQGIEVVRVGI